MRLSRTWTIAVVFSAFAAGPALAEDSLCPELAPAADTGTHIDSGALAIGIDISRAGENKESRMVFFNQLSLEEKTDVCSHCRSSGKTGTVQLSTDERSFCQSILSVQ